MSGATSTRRRFVGIIALGTLALLAGAPDAHAETTSETGVSVEFADTGTLDIHFSDEPVQFLSNGEDPAPTAVDAAIATGTLTLIVHDTRADAERHGYTVAFSSTGLETDEGALLEASHLAVLDIEGLPEGVSAAQLVGVTLEQPVTLLTVRDGDAAIDATLAITIQLTIPSGSMPGSYSGGFVPSGTPFAGPGG